MLKPKHRNPKSLPEKYTNGPTRSNYEALPKHNTGGLPADLNVQGASKGGGTLRAYDVGGRIHWFIEGYDDPADNPGNWPGARQL